MAEIVSLFYSKSITPRAKREFLNRQSLRLSRWSLIDHFTVVDLVPWPLSECEAEVDLVLIQTFFALLWKLSLKNTSQHKNSLIYIIKQEGLYQNKFNSSLASIHNCKMAYYVMTWSITFFKAVISIRGNRRSLHTSYLTTSMYVIYHGNVVHCFVGQTQYRFA